jgi:YNFM family putative membrane transporter
VSTAAVGTPLHLPGTPGFRRLNGAMVLAGLAAFGILYAAQPVLPEIGDEFGVGPGTASLAVSASTGALAVAVIPSAALAVRWGRVRTMRLGMLLAVLLTLLTAVAPTFTVLVVLRALTGIVLAGVVAVAMGHVGAEVHGSGLGAAMGLYVAGNSLGGVSGRLVTSVVADGTSWRWGVGVLALAALVATILFWWLLPEPVGTTDVPDDADPHALRTLLRRPAVLALVAVPFTLMGGFVAVYNYLSYRLLDAPFSLPLSLVGLVFLAYLAGTGSSAVAGRLADSLGRPRVLVASIVVAAAGLALTLPDRLGLVIVGLVVFTAGFFAAHATASGWAPVVAAPYGTQGSALYVCGYYAGSSVFGAVLGLAWAGPGWGGVVTGVAALLVVGLLAASYVIVQTSTRISSPSRAPSRSSRSSPDQNLPGS